MTKSRLSGPQTGWRADLHEIIFGTHTPAGRRFDVVLLWAILLSVLAVILESVAGIRREYGMVLRTLEWSFTLLFSVEYLLRLYSSPRPIRYVLSFFGLVDLVAVAPTYLSLFVAGTQTLIVIRALRLLRVFRVLKLGQYWGEAHVLMSALRASRHKVTVFLGGVVTTVLIVGSTMYLIEGEEHGFTSIPTAMYWAVVTMTTVGYGDIAPRTVVGQTLAAMLMIIGYGVIAVPTGIVSAELVEAQRHPDREKACAACGLRGHAADAVHCRKCGVKLQGTE
jgi:voltage-gated potassium channel